MGNLAVENFISIPRQCFNVLFLQRPILKLQKCEGAKRLRIYTRVYARLPQDGKVAQNQCKNALESWKQVDFLKEGTECDTYLSNRKIYRSSLHTSLKQLESDRVHKPCIAVETDDKLLWKLLKGQKSSSQMTPFVVEGKLLTDENDIRNLWADHFEALGTPLLTQASMMNLQIKFQIRYETSLVYAWKTHQEALTNR